MRIRFCLILVPLICHCLLSAASDSDLGQPTLITGLNGVVNSLTISPDGKMMLAGADQMRAYATESLEPLSPVMDGTTNISDAAFSKDSEVLVVARGKRHLEFWSTRTWEKTAESHEAGVFWEVECNTQRNECLASGGQPTIFCFSTSTGALLRKEETRFQRISGLLMLPDGKRFVSVGQLADKSHAVQVRDAQTLKLMHTLGQGTGGIDRLTLSQDGNTLLSCTVDGKLQRWDLMQKTMTGEWQLDQPRVRALAFFDNDQRAFVGGWSRKLNSINLNSGAVQVLDVPPAGGITAAKVLSNPVRLVYAPGRQDSAFRVAVHPLSHATDASVATAKPAAQMQPAKETTHDVGSIRWPAESSEPARVAVILFCPKGVQPPDDFQEGIDRLADYTDDFILSGLRRWKHEPATKTLFRKQGEHVEVLSVIGKNGEDAYTDPSVHKEAIAAAQEHFQIAPRTHVWWVLVYKGDPPQRFEDFRGGSSPEFGAWAVANYDSRARQLKPGTPLGAPMLQDMALKGMIHELGHAFRLPHIGPRFKLSLGNTLMGPTHLNFRRVQGRDEHQAYLSEAAASMLCAHPVIRNRTLMRTSVPSVQLTEAELTNRPEGKSIRVRGRIESDRQPLYAIVGDHSESLPSEYWVRHYVGAVDKQGRFEIEVTEPERSNGELRLWFVFINGEITGNGKQQGAGSATTIPYRFEDGRWLLNNG